MTKKNKNELIENLFYFLDNSPTAWHAVDCCQEKLLKLGFYELKEKDSWKLKPSQNYFVTRNGSSICAFSLPSLKPKSFRIAASHTDSPSLKLKPNAAYKKENMVMLSLEVYGSPILTSWLNRDLQIAGRILFTDNNNEICEKIVLLKDFFVAIPTLAIHLDRSINDKSINEEGIKVNKQSQLSAIAAIENTDSQENFIEKILKKTTPFKHLLSHELFLVPKEKAAFIGENNSLIASYRVDSLASVHACLEAFSQKRKLKKHEINMINFSDNEEVGSETSQGASSTFMSETLERIIISLGYDRETYFQILSQSFLASVDLGHAFHPHYENKHEPQHIALLNKGVLIKTNAQQRYASNAKSLAEIINLCHKEKIPFQHYVSRGDIPCGTTIGPIHATKTGISTVDIGIPQLSMHASREIMGTEDHSSLFRLLSAFFN